MSEVLLRDMMSKGFPDAFDDDEVTEISVNKPGEFFVARKGVADMVRHDAPSLDYQTLRNFATLIATTTGQTVDEQTPLLSAQIRSAKYPDLFYRIQVVHDPAVYKGRIALSIRKPSVVSLEYEAYQEMFANVRVYDGVSEAEQELSELYRHRRYWEFLKKAVLVKKNILISAGTDSGKTTLFNSLIKLIPSNERIITIEDAKELDPPQPNTLQLYYSRGNQGIANVTAQSLMEACLRLRPQRLFLGEVRGAEAFTFLNIISSGHPGAIATLHADTPKQALERMALMCLQAGTTLTAETIKEYVENNIDVIVQLKRTPTGGYGCESIYYKDKTH
ncbi:MAG: P-type DNA transfer ATPase VirB11 [Neisseria animaloris]|nr:P-type DNA transfer ATPase VirB11 [Neisseria animaloris]